MKITCNVYSPNIQEKKSLSFFDSEKINISSQGSQIWIHVRPVDFMQFSKSVLSLEDSPVLETNLDLSFKIFHCPCGASTLLPAVDVWWNWISNKQTQDALLTAFQN